MTERHDWHKDAVMYELYVRAFRDSNGDGHGDLAGVVERLDYLTWLGVDVVWLLPIYPSPLRDDGYDVSDFTNVHPDHGTLGDFTRLVEEAHARGIKIITDLVLNHTSNEHPWFQESRRGPSNPKADWYVWSDDPERYSGTRVIFSDTESSNWTFDTERGQYYWHRFFRHQPDLNFDNPDVREEMKRVAKFWIDLGIDGFRMDAIPYLFEREGTTSENLAPTHAYLKELRAYINGLRPDLFILGEVNQWPQDTLSYFGSGNDEMTLLFHFPVMPRLFEAIARGQRDSVEYVLDQTPAIPDGSQWVVFLRNHDELTLEMVSDEERVFMYETYAPDPRMRLNVGIRRRLAPLLGNDMRKVRLLMSVVMTLPGTPVLYYGDEIGMGDNIHLEDRDGVRTPMQWHAGNAAGFSEAEKTFAPPIDQPPFDYHSVNVAAQRADEGSLLHWVRTMIAQRRAHAALGRGSFALLRPSNKAVLAFHNVHENDVVISVHNLSDEPQSVVLDLSQHEGRALREAFTSEPLKASASTQLTLEPYDLRWYVPANGSPKG